LNQSLTGSGAIYAWFYSLLGARIALDRGSVIIIAENSAMCRFRSIVTAMLLGVFALAPVIVLAQSPSCDKRVNNTNKKLLECVTLDGVREHQAAFQAIADGNGGIRSEGTPGYSDSVGYIVQRMTAAGYDVTIEEFNTPTTTWNVFAETRKGNRNNVIMVGAHLDSVAAGPGIQDNGSGSAAILEVAEQMAKVKPRNTVRFAWWGAEESGLAGSMDYVNNLTPEEKDDIAMYLNFDMVGSPNFVRFIYNGAGVPCAIQSFFEAYYANHDLAFELIPAIDFLSAHQTFIDAGIPAGGLFTGAEGIKTPEQAAVFGGVAGSQYDPCYHLACDTFDNVNLEVLDQNADAIAAAVLFYAMKKN
jgi:Zn-dependent M28 family amino/carboxypeptidase